MMVHSKYHVIDGFPLCDKRCINAHALATDMLQRAASRRGWAGDLQSLVYGDGSAGDAWEAAESDDDELFRPKGGAARHAKTVC